MTDSAPSQWTYRYPRPALTVDVALVTDESVPRILLIKRKHDPFAGRWALPGGFVDENEPLEAAARRELREETSVAVTTLEQVGTFGDPGRDPRGWTVSVVYLARVDQQLFFPKAADDAAEVGWHDLSNPPSLAFDHALIVAEIRRRLEL